MNRPLHPDGADLTLQEQPSEQQDFKKDISLFRLACKNIRTYFWMNAKMCFTFACLAFLICLFTVYNVALNEQRDTIVNESASSNYFYSQNAANIEEFKEQFPNTSLEDHYWLHNFADDIYLRYGVGGQYLSDSSFFALGIGDKEYRATEKLSFGCAAHEKDDFFTPADYEELRARFGKQSFFEAGNYPATEKEVAVGMPMLKAYGLDADDVLGKELTILIKDPRAGKDPLQSVTTATVSGVITADFYKLSGHKSGGNTRPFFLFKSDNSFMAKKKIARYRVYLTTWPEEMEADGWEFSGSSSVYSYVGYGNVSKVDTINGIQVLATNLYVIIGSALSIGLILTIFLMIDKYMKVFSRSSGILMTLGMRRSRLFLLLGIQLFLLCLIAVPIAFILTAGGYLTITFIIGYMTAIDLTVSRLQLLGMLLLGIVAVVLISFFFFLYALFKFRFKTIKQYLTTVVN